MKDVQFVSLNVHGVKYQSIDTMGRVFNNKLNIPLSKINGQLMDGQANWDYPQLYTKLQTLGKTGKLKCELFDQAIRQLKPQEAVSNPSVKSLSDAWIHFDDMDDECRSLIGIQQNALQNKRYRLALAVYSCYGIASKELFHYIEALRGIVRHHTREIRTEPLLQQKERQKLKRR